MSAEKTSVYCVRYAVSSLPESMVFENGDKGKTLPITFAIYLVQLGDRNILIDAGCDTMPGFDMREFVSPAIALSDIGVKPEDITDVIVTHAYHDHIDALRHFAKARVYIQQEEYAVGKRYIPAETAV